MWIFFTLEDERLAPTAITQRGIHDLPFPEHEDLERQRWFSSGVYVDAYFKGLWWFCELVFVIQKLKG